MDISAYAKTQTFSPPTIEDIESALHYIDPNMVRDEWAKVGMALKAELGDSGFDVFDSWSEGGSNYKASDVKSTWHSINGGGGIGIATLFHYAKEAGWKREKPNALVDEAARLKRQQQRQADNEKAEAAKHEKNETAALTAHDRWEAASDASPQHPYLIKKGIKPIGIKQEGNNLLIPMQDEHGRIMSLQTIAPDGTKLFQKDGATSGMYMRLVGTTASAVICEGYATAVSIHAATGANVAVAFSCHNLMPVAVKLRGKLPNSDIIIAGDSKPESTLEKAREVAKTINARLAIPTVDSDFNDMACAGYDLAEVFQRAVNIEMPESEAYVWPEPEPLPRALVPVDAFDDAWLPETVRPWISDISERIQCPPDFPAVGAMVSLASTIGRKIAIRPKQYDDWMEVPNLWGAVVGRPGIMKSPALAESMRPLNRLAMEAQKQHREAVDEAESGAEIRAAQVKALRSELVKSCAGKGTRQADDIAAEMEALKAGDEAEPCQRFKVNDATVEKLGELLAENPNGLLMFRDELVGWLRALDRDGAENTRPFFLEAWNGMSSYTYDRIGRGTLHIEHACLGVLGGIQPGPLSVYVRGAIKNGQGADGLLQRIQLLVWPDDSGQWKDVDRYPDSGAKDNAYAVFQRLAELSPDDVGAVADEYNQQPWLRFSEPAQELFTLWRDERENTKLRSGEHEVIESHLSKYRKLIPALALVIHLAEYGTGPVTEQALIKACAWGEYLESHARRIYAVGTAPDLRVAHALLDKIKQGRLSSPFKPAEVYHKGWSELDKDGTYKAIEVLAEYGWLAVDQVQTGGRPSTICRINPSVSP